ncbi:MAG: pseudouridine synthase [Paracoccaceae bacterium]
MTDDPTQERIAKRLARAGVASRREAERMIEAGRVAVDGARIDSPALNVGAGARITVDGKPVAAPAPARLWTYHKPAGLVTSAADEKGRRTVFDALPEGMPRVVSVGRLDLNSEGLLLLTNDGGLKRRLELPSTGWLRRYRVRIHGALSEDRLEALRTGIEVEGERFRPMEARFDRVQGANAWLTLGLREGRNREIRRAMEALGVTVNRLIRISYGPFQLGALKPGEVAEVPRRVLADQLGETPPVGTAKAKRRPARRGGAGGPGGSGGRDGPGNKGGRGGPKPAGGPGSGPHTPRRGKR